MVVLLVYAWPGYVTQDSLEQYDQARNHHYNNWHPPAMAALWTVVDKVVTGTAGMLLLQCACFVAGTFLILRRMMSDRTAAIVTSLVLVFPPVLSTMACIWKDSQMAGFLLLGIGLLVGGKRWQLVLGAVILLFASAMRFNAAAATLPVLVVLFHWKHGHVWWKRLGLACVVWVFTVSSSFAINKLLTREERHAWHLSIAPGDIIGTLKYSRDYTDAELIELFDQMPLSNYVDIQAHMRTYYNPYFWWFYEAPGPARVMYFPETDAHRASLEHAWKQVVRDNPRAYLLHRLRVFRGLLGLTHGLPLFGPVCATHADVETDHTLYPASGVQGILADSFLWLATNTPLFRPYPFFFLALLLLYFARRQPIALALLTSGILYELPLFFISPSADNRYSHWMVTTTVIAVAVLVASRLRLRSTARPAGLVASA
jgi:hypothetical protein